MILLRSRDQTNAHMSLRRAACCCCLTISSSCLVLLCSGLYRCLISKLSWGFCTVWRCITAQASHMSSNDLIDTLRIIRLMNIWSKTTYKVFLALKQFFFSCSCFPVPFSFISCFIWLSSTLVSDSLPVPVCLPLLWCLPLPNVFHLCLIILTYLECIVCVLPVFALCCKHSHSDCSL